MIQSFRLTLYELFGYLLPGSIVTLALAVILWATYFPDKSLPICTLSNQMWLAMIGISYFSGHLVQALGNWLGSAVNPEELIFGKHAKSSDDIIAKAVRSTISSWGLEVDKLDPSSILQICDETMVQTGTVTDREIFIYREGFYRGTCVAFLVLSAALFIRFLRGGGYLALHDGSVPLSASMWLFFVLLSLVASGMAFLRFKRFAKHRVRSALTGFLVLQRIRNQPTPGNSGSTERLLSSDDRTR